MLPVAHPLAAASALRPHDNKENLRADGDATKNGVSHQQAAAALVKRDFFGRVVEVKPLAELDGNSAERRARREERKVWVTFHEGLNNAVRKPISLQEFMRAL